MNPDPADTSRPFADAFAEPSPWRMPAAYWFWHRSAPEEELRDQVRQMHAAGIRGFQVQARIALPLDRYLDDEYLAACRIAVDEASRLGMVVGFYDEYNWQSGHAGGRVVDGFDELRERHLFWTRGIVSGGTAQLAIDDIVSSTEIMGEPGMQWHYDDGRVEWGDWTPVLAAAGELGASVAVPARVVEAGPTGCRIQVDADLPDGTPVTVFVTARSTTSRLIDYFEPRAVARYLEVGYAPFVEAMGDHVGATVAYVFFDQPHANFYTWAQHDGDLTSSMPWHDDLAAALDDRFGDTLPDVLLALLDTGGPAHQAARARFYRLHGDLAIERYFAPIHAWTSAHGLLFTGHEVLAHVGRWSLGGAFGSWDLRVNFGLDYFAIDRHRDLTSVDAQDSNPQLSAKLGDSVARASGRRGTIVEQYFGTTPTAPGVYAGHWDLGLGELRAQTFRHHLLGMRQLLFHGFYQTDGWDDDPTPYSNPRFDFPPGVNFEPWFAEHHAAFAAESGRLSEFLDRFERRPRVAVVYPRATALVDGQGGPHAALAGDWFEALARAGHDYDIVDERDLTTSTSANGVITVAGRPYAVVVLPGVRVLESIDAVAALGAAAKAGVRVVVSGSAPQLAVDTAETVAAFPAGLPAPPAPSDTAAWSDAFGEPGAPAVVGGPAWRFLGTRATPAGEVWGAAVFSDAETEVELALALPGDLVREWRVADGIPIDRDPALLAAVRLAPGELRLFEVGPAGAWPAGPPTAAVAPAAGELLPAPAAWTFRLPGETEGRPIATTRGWQEQGLPTYSGVGIYRAEVDLPVGRVRVEAPAVAGSLLVRLDGVEAGRRGWAPFGVVLEVATAGLHVVELEVASAAGNRYYAGTPWRDGPEPAGLLAEPLFRLLEEG